MKEFNFKKQFGQNFISDKNLLRAIVLDAGVDKNSNVLEIGPGMGSLTSCLCEKAKFVYSVEIDKTLKPYLDEVVSSNDNLKVEFNDIMKMDTKSIDLLFDDKYKIVANLPYYITTPIMFKFLEESDRVESITVMVQKEVAERICATNKSSNYGILSIMCEYYAERYIKRIVKKDLFYPIPKVDSAIVHLKIRNDIDRNFAKKLHKILQISFAMKRKTLVNNLMSGMNFSRENAIEVLEKIGKYPNARAEELTLEEWINFVNLI